MSDKQSYLTDLFINEAKPALSRHSGGGSGLDTSDATATQEDIKAGKTAYVNGVKVNGSLDTQAIHDAGVQSEYDRFWDTFQKFGTLRNYDQHFGGSGWTDDLFKPKYDIILTGYNSRVFRSNTRITDLYAATIGRGIRFDTSAATSLSEMFGSCVSLKRVPPINTQSLSLFDNVFLWCEKLETIDELYVHENLDYTYIAFDSCRSLTNLTVTGTIGKNDFNVQWSTLLTHDSLMSIINALKDYSEDTSGTVWKVTIGSENKAKLTEDDLNIAWNKGWEVV